MKKEQVLSTLFVVALIIGIVTLVDRGTDNSGITARVLDTQSQQAVKEISEINQQIEDVVSSSRRLRAGNRTIENLLEQRKDLILTQAQRDATVVSSLRLASKIESDLIKVGYSNVESLLSSTSGKLEIVIYDDFTNFENSKTEYYLISSDGTKRRMFPFDDRELEAGSTVKIINGIKLGENILGETKSLSINIFASPSIVEQSQKSTIHWYVQNATSCEGTGGSPGWAGTKNPNGGVFQTSFLYNTVTYNLICSNANGASTIESVTVKVVEDIDDYFSEDILTFDPFVEDSEGYEEPDSYHFAVFLTNPQGVSIPHSANEVYEMLFEGQANSFIKEATYDRFSLSGDVYGWIDVATSFSNTCPEASVDLYQEPQFANYITQNNINLDQYNHIIFVMNCYTEESQGLIARSSVGPMSYRVGNEWYEASIMRLNLSPEMFEAFWKAYNYSSPQPFSWTNLDAMFSHELSHSLGTYHAFGMDCGEESISDNCEELEHGNFFDVVTGGNQNTFLFSYHQNSAYKKKLGWLAEEQALFITESGTYSLSPLETKNGVKLAWVINPEMPDTAKKYALEYRQGIGFDESISFFEELSQNQDGLLINLKDGTKSYLIDSKPTEAGWSGDLVEAALDQGSIFHDEEMGITIGNVKKLYNGVSFYVAIGEELPECNHNTPSLEFSSPAIYSLGFPEFSTSFLKVNNTNVGATCGQSQFQINITPNNGVLNKYTFYKDIFAGESGNLDFGEENNEVMVNPGTSLGEYDYTVSVKEIGVSNANVASVPITIKVVQ